eukprot:Tbor_TRINITY_DN6021_c1_g1::TRINITY_DN6021_c1_g1_i1::g.11139::m.11139
MTNLATTIPPSSTQPNSTQTQTSKTKAQKAAAASHNAKVFTEEIVKKRISHNIYTSSLHNNILPMTPITHFGIVQECTKAASDITAMSACKVGAGGVGVVSSELSCVMIGAAQGNNNNNTIDNTIYSNNNYSNNN